MDHTVYNVYNDLAGELYGEGLFDPNSLVEAIGPLVDIDPNMGCSSSNGNRVEGSGQVMLNNPTEDLQGETSSPRKIPTIIINVRIHHFQLPRVLASHSDSS